MPRSAPMPCRVQGCARLVDRPGYCDRHIKQKSDAVRQSDKNRGTAAQRGYNSKWRKARMGFLRLHPLCAECEKAGRVTVATVVDHIIPHRMDKSLFWDRKNWQPLCKSCHDRKTATQDRKSRSG